MIDLSGIKKIEVDSTRYVARADAGLTAGKFRLGHQGFWLRGGTAAAIPIGYPQLREHGPISLRPVEQMAFIDSLDRPFT